MNTVRCRTTHGYNVPWERWQYGAPDTAREGFLLKDALQCDDGFLPWVSLPSGWHGVLLSTYQLWPVGRISFGGGCVIPTSANSGT